MKIETYLSVAKMRIQFMQKSVRRVNEDWPYEDSSPIATNED